VIETAAHDEKFMFRDSMIARATTYRLETISRAKTALKDKRRKFCATLSLGAMVAAEEELPWLGAASRANSSRRVILQRSRRCTGRCSVMRSIAHAEFEPQYLAGSLSARGSRR